MLKDLKVVIGLGKTGIAVVRHLRKMGFNVAVTDSRQNPPGLQELRDSFPEVPVFINGFDPAILNQACEIIISPGVSILESVLQKNIKPGTPIVGDIELFARKTKSKVVAITGSNGKSTVTTLVGSMAKMANINVQVGGNLGTPVLDLMTTPEPDLYVLELSSFQLETTYSLKPEVATVLNISPDHLDRYLDLNDYIAAKMRIFHNCYTAVLNRYEDFYTNSIFTNLYPCLCDRVLTFGLNLANAPHFGLSDNFLMCGTQKLINVDELKIKGKHQVANALAALALGYAVGLPFQAMLDALREFPGLPHRCQWVRTLLGVDWYNDSKGTNVGATLAAIIGLGSSIQGKLVVIAGGQGKNADFLLLSNAVKQYVKTLILIGEDANKIETALIGLTNIVHTDSMQGAVEIAAKSATLGDAVLLSPACASFDMFKNFEHRGEVFMELVKNVPI